MASKREMTNANIDGYGQQMKTLSIEKMEDWGRQKKVVRKLPREKQRKFYMTNKFRWVGI